MSTEAQISELTTQIAKLTTVVQLQNKSTTELLTKHDREIYGDAGEAGLKSKQAAVDMQLDTVLNALDNQDKKRFKRDLALYSLMLSTIVALVLIVINPS